LSELKKIRARQAIRWSAGLALFLVLGGALRLLLLPINQAEYTDGIIQLNQFSEWTGIYPPLYTAVCWPLSFVMGQLWAGRLVSTVFSTLGVIPLYLLARRSFGMRAAMFAALVYTVAPVSLRWSPRVMTDSMFAFFFWFSIDRLHLAQGAQDEKTASKALFHSCLWGGLAALTRYQGLMLAPPVVVMAIYLRMHRGFLPWKGMLGLACFLAAPVWSHIVGNIHGEQFGERMAYLGPWMTFLLTSEPFLLTMPYFLTYPVAFLALIGMMVGQARDRYMMTPITVYTLAVLLVAQSLFASFQERYFLPFYGILFVWAGLGMAVVDDRARRRWPRVRSYTPMLVTIWSLFIATLVLLGSRGAFGDIAAASRFVRGMARQEAGLRVYTNEIYRRGANSAPDIAATKVRFFSRQPAEHLTPAHYAGRAAVETGAVLVISGRDVAGENLAGLMQKYTLEEIGSFRSHVTPIFPDIMQDRQIEQSPMAWLYRYMPQSFETKVYRVLGTRGGP